MSNQWQSFGPSNLTLSLNVWLLKAISNDINGYGPTNNGHKSSNVVENLCADIDNSKQESSSPDNKMI